MKRYGRDEPIGVVIHICMETTQGIYCFFKEKMSLLG
jgi:hypothetical protein